MPARPAGDRGARLRLCLCLAVLLLAGLLLDMAPSGAQSGSYLTPRESYRVFIIGDALAGGLWAGMERAARGDARLLVTGRYKEDSGLARPEIYDWTEALPKIFEQQEIDIAVIMLGSNDGQDMRPPGGRIAFGTPEWLAAYEAEMAALLEALKQRGTAVYWVGVPPMAAPENEREARLIDGKQSEVLKARGIRKIDIRPQFSAADGSYTDSGPDVEGRFVRLRSRNGVNFLKVGNDKLAKLVLDALRADIAAAGETSAAASDETSQAKGDAQPVLDPALPMFGQGLVTGGAQTLKSDSLPPVGAVSVNRSGKGPADRQFSSDTAGTSSADSAAALYGQGRWPTVKPGRIDDFSWPTKQP